jgi:acetyltransferase-like isoleucine patch superfamily enzyme
VGAQEEHWIMGWREVAKALLGRRRPDEFTDGKLRADFAARYNIVVGLYSYGCFDRSRIDPNTKIGRYCSFASTAVVLNRNHGLSFIGTTPYLYNARLGCVPCDSFDYDGCEIGDDVWLGHNSTVAPGCRRIGRGAVVAAGAVVTDNVAPYAVMAGVPARQVRLRFEPSVIRQIDATRWWEWDLPELQRRLAESPDLILHPAEHFSRPLARRAG